MPVVTVEAIENHADGSTTILGTTAAGCPVVHTFPAGAEVPVLACARCGHKLRQHRCPHCEKR